LGTKERKIFSRRRKIKYVSKHLLRKTKESHTFVG